MSTEVRTGRPNRIRHILSRMSGELAGLRQQLEDGELDLLELLDDDDLPILQELAEAATAVGGHVEAALRARRETEVHRTRRTSPRPLRWSRFAAVPPRAAGDARLTATELRILIGVAAFADRRGACRASQGTLAHVAGVHRTTALRALRRLEELGYIRRERFMKAGPDGGAIRGTDLIQLVYTAPAVAPMDATAGMATDDDNAEAMRHVPAVAETAVAAVAESASAAVAPMDATAISPTVEITYRGFTTPEGARVRARKRVATTSDIAHESDIATDDQERLGEDGVVELRHRGPAVPDARITEGGHA